MRMQAQQQSMNSCLPLALYLPSNQLRQREGSMQVLLPGKAAPTGSVQVPLPGKLAQVGRWASPGTDRPGGNAWMTLCLWLHCAMAGIPGECLARGPSSSP